MAIYFHDHWYLFGHNIRTQVSDGKSTKARSEVACSRSQRFSLPSLLIDGGWHHVRDRENLFRDSIWKIDRYSLMRPRKESGARTSDCVVLYILLIEILRIIGYRDYRSEEATNHLPACVSPLHNHRIDLRDVGQQRDPAVDLHTLQLSGARAHVLLLRDQLPRLHRLVEEIYYSQSDHPVRCGCCRMWGWLAILL